MGRAGLTDGLKARSMSAASCSSAHSRRNQRGLEVPMAHPLLARCVAKRRLKHGAYRRCGANRPSLAFRPIRGSTAAIPHRKRECGL
jgi:hypothetical protein